MLTPSRSDAMKLPLTLLDALRALEKSSVLKAAFGDTLVSSHVQLKTSEWNSHSPHLTEWERQMTPDR